MAAESDRRRRRMDGAARRQGARREEARDEARERIIEAARRLFTADGYPAVSIRRIMGEAGGATMSFYTYFESKQALLRVLWGDILDEMFEVSAAAVEQAARDAPAGAEAVARRRAFLRAYAQFWWANADKFRLVFLVEDRLESGQDSFYVDTARIYERFSAAGGLGDAAPDSPEAKALELQLQTALASITGLLLIHITISEYPWRAFDEMLDEMLARLTG
ncbi:MAG: helix-turn-helix domain-containing protein [Pseudomonadota bacterium]